MGLLISSLPQKSQLFSLWTQEMTANESPDITNYTAKCPTFKSITSLVVWPWANYLLSWYPSTLICKTGYNDSKFLELWWGFNELVYLQMLRTMPATHSSHSMNIYYYHDNMNHYHIFLNYLDQIARSYFFFLFSPLPLTLNPSVNLFWHGSKTYLKSSDICTTTMFPYWDQPLILHAWLSQWSPKQSFCFHSLSVPSSQSISKP